MSENDSHSLLQTPTGPAGSARWWHRPWQLHRAILTFVCLLVLTTALGIGLSGYLYSRSAVERLTSERMRGIAEQTRDRVYAYLEPAEAVLKLNRALVETDEARFGALKAAPPTPAQRRARAELFLRVLRAYPQFEMMHYGDQFGYFTAARRHPTQGWVVIQRWLEGKKTRRAVYRIGKDGRWQPDSEPDDPFDCRQRPWYIQAANQRRLIWTPPYRFHAERRPGLTAALPLLHNGALRGVFGVDFVLRELDGLVQSLSRSGRRVFLFAEDYNATEARHLHILAQPNSADSLPSQETLSSGTRLELPLAAESRDPALRAAADRLLTRRREARNGAIVPDLAFTAGETRFLATVSLLPVGADQRWSVVVAEPEAVVLGEVNANGRRTLLLCAGLLGLAVLAATVFSLQITRPLRAFVQEMDRVGNFDIPEVAVPGSRILEIDQMADELEKMKASLRSFGKYVPSDVVAPLVRQGKEAVLGGQTERITVFFADIISFSTISEQMTPEALVAAMASYLEEMETIVRRHEGILDKYSGDSVMAFWGAPARPVADHERQACLAALEYVERFRALRARCEQEGRTFFEAGIGIHTGEALVGNIGSEHRLNYTAMGDTVNVTSRLEALNRLYGTRILISETTYDRVAAEFETRLIDTVIVKGRRNPTRLYELLSRKGQLSDLQRRLGALYAEGLEQYQCGSWDTALERFEAGLALVPDDGPCLALRARCLQYRQAPPAEDWNGVYVSTSK